MVGDEAEKTCAFPSYAHCENAVCSLGGTLLTFNMHALVPDKEDSSAPQMGALPLKDENQITIIFPGSRDALQLHETDKRVTKGLKMRAQSRSRSSRARSNSAMSRGRSESRGRSGSRTGSVRSGSAIVEHTNAKFAAFFEDEKSTIHDMMRVLRMVGNKKDEAPPAGFWTAKSRPASIVNRIYMDENETKIKKKKEWKILKEKLKLKWGRKSGGEDKVRSQSRSESVKTTAAKPVDGKKPAAGKGKSATKAKSKK